MLMVSIPNDCLASYIEEPRPSGVFYPGTAATEHKLGNYMLQNRQMGQTNEMTVLKQVTAKCPSEVAC